MGKFSANSGKFGKKKPTRQASLQRKPVIEVKGKLGKAQKSRKKKIKKIVPSTADYYEDKVDGDREKTVKDEAFVINSAPKNLQQEMPRKVRALMRAQKDLVTTSMMSKKELKAHRNGEIKKQQDSVNSWFKRPVADTPKFVKNKGESDKAYYARVETESNDFMKIAKYENQNDCKVTQNEKGDVVIEKKVRRKQIKNKEFREKMKAKKTQTISEEESIRDFSDFTDEVKFNERIDRPPELSAKPRKALDKTNKTEKLASLKFMGILEKSSGAKKEAHKQSLVYKERMDVERQRVIDMYRSMKAKKRSDALT